jgi:peptidoglycan/xylan/chitin deacetylase (PgdA/CDA1 family)
MPKAGTVFLMYHELELPGRPLCQTEPGYVRYILRCSEFEAQMQTLQAAGWHGVNVSSALQYAASKEVALTFDDGCETDLLAAAPLLIRLGFGATFYVTAGFIGTPGYLSPAQLRELSGAGFEIGCHSMTHTYLTDLDRAGLHREMVTAKLNLERIIGKAVEHFSCPGGRWSRDVVEVARQAGYRSVAHSEVRANSASTDPLALGRIAIMRGTSLPEFMKICRGETLWRRSASDTLRTQARKFLGNRWYDRIRGAVLGVERWQ